MALPQSDIHHFRKTFSVILVVFLISACSDSLLNSNRQPSRLIIQPSNLEMIVGKAITFNAKLVDSKGAPFKNVPAWIDTAFIGSRNLIKVKNNEAITIKAGKTKLAIKIGGFMDKVNLRIIPRLYMTQSVQELSRNIPMVAGRDGVLRVFLQGKEREIAQANISLQIYHKGTLVRTLDYPEQNQHPTKISNSISALALPVPGSNIQPGLSVLATIGNKTYPKSSTPHPIKVVNVPEFHIRLIPIYVPATGKTGNVNSQNVDEYMEATLDMYPLNNYVVDVHEPITVSVNPSNQRAFYQAALVHIKAIWLAEGSPDYYYYGVIPQKTGGTIGLGYTSTNPKSGHKRQAVGWDRPGWQYRSETMAHELGHNMGRLHAPCAPPGLNLSDVDPLYPYLNASIGVYGYEVDQEVLKSPAVYKDLMSYCRPAWISDYTYLGVMNFRKAANNFNRATKQPQDVLLLWGRKTNDNLILKPAFRIKAPVSMPQQSGRYTLSGYDKKGNQVFSFSFTGTRIADLRGARQFAFTVPIERVNINALQTIKLSSRNLQAMQRATIPSSPDPYSKQLIPNVSAQRINSKTVRLQGKSSGYRMALVKDAQTGEVIGFTRNGLSEIKTNAQKLKLYFSDGVHTKVSTVTVK